MKHILYWINKFNIILNCWAPGGQTSTLMACVRKFCLLSNGKHLTHKFRGSSCRETTWVERAKRLSIWAFEAVTHTLPQKARLVSKKASRSAFTVTRKLHVSNTHFLRFVDGERTEWGTCKWASGTNRMNKSSFITELTKWNTQDC